MPSRGERIWSGFLALADPLAALIAGISLGVLGLLGAASGENLAAATLLVLSVVALALLRERSQRLSTEHGLESMRGQLLETRDALNALHAGAAYHVPLHETTWDIAEQDGSLVNVRRLKRIRFDQNDVVSLYDFVTGSGSRESEYTPGKVVDEFWEGAKKYALISLGRIHSRGEELNMITTRTARNAFTESQEGVTVETRDLTERLRMTIMWPATRPPRVVRVVTISATRQRVTAVVTQDVRKEGTRSVYRLDVEKPEKGSDTTIEWEW